MTGPYCSSCGQKQVQQNLTLSEFLKETTQELTHLEGKVPATLKVSDDEFRSQREDLDTVRLALIQQRKQLANRLDWLEPCRAFLSFSQLAVSCFRDGDPSLKRLIVKTLGSNLTLNDGILTVQANNPFRVWPKPVPSTVYW